MSHTVLLTRTGLEKWILLRTSSRTEDVCDLLQSRLLNRWQPSWRRYPWQLRSWHKVDWKLERDLLCSFQWPSSWVLTVMAIRWLVDRFVCCGVVCRWRSVPQWCNLSSQELDGWYRHSVINEKITGIDKIGIWVIEPFFPWTLPALS